MKKLFILLAVLLSGFSLNAQSYSGIKMEKPEEIKAAEKQVMQASSYLLSNPIDQNKEARREATSFILRWMEATPDYTFDIDAKFQVQFGQELLPLMLAASAVYFLEHPAEAKADGKKAMTASYKIFFDYCKGTANHAMLNTQQQKLADAYAQGKLDEELAKIK